MDRNSELEEFIKRAQEELKEEAEEVYKKSKNKINERKRDYFSSPKGKEARKRGWRKRAQLLKDLCQLLTPEEKEEIKKFYANCPIGYQVDHIVSLAKGGEHRLSNLQYLRAEENKRKFTMTMEDAKEYFKFIDELKDSIKKD